jgi:hypothetical protein
MDSSMLEEALELNFQATNRAVVEVVTDVVVEAETTVVENHLVEVMAAAKDASVVERDEAMEAESHQAEVMAAAKDAAEAQTEAARDVLAVADSEAKDAEAQKAAQEEEGHKSNSRNVQHSGYFCFKAIVHEN